MDIYIAIRYVAKYGSTEILGVKNDIDECDKLIQDHAIAEDMDEEKWEWIKYGAPRYEHENVVRMYGHTDGWFEAYHVYEIQKHILPGNWRAIE